MWNWSIRSAMILVSISLIPSSPANSQESGTPGDGAGLQSQPLPEPNASFDGTGADVGVLAYCTDLAGIFGAENTVNTLAADGRFGSVMLIE